jgi:hypothetical protein
MTTGSWTRIISIVTGSTLVAVGVVPLVFAGVADLISGGPISIFATNTGIVIFALLLAFVASIATSNRDVGIGDWARGLNLRMLALSAITVAVILLAVASIDGANNSAWRNANTLVAGPGSSKLTLKEYGRHIARLQFSRSTMPDASAGVLPVTWDVWLTGGKSKLLLRVPQIPGSTSQDACDDIGELKLRAVAQGTVLIEEHVPVRDICGRWKLVQMELLRGVTELHVGVGNVPQDGDYSVDVIVASIEPNLKWLWIIIAALSLGFVIAIVYIVSEYAKEVELPLARSQPSRNNRSRAQRLYTYGAVLFFIIFSNLFVYGYVSQEKTIYTWDFSGYWMSSRYVSELLGGAERNSITEQSSSTGDGSGETAKQEPALTVPDPDAIGALIRNIRFSEYNITTNLAVAPAMAVLGGSRVVYELSMLNTFALAAVVLLIFAVRASGGGVATRWPGWWPFIPVLVIFSCVPFWIPILRGYMGISILGVNLAVFWLYFRQPIQKISTQSLVAIGVLLLAGVILQRWNAYWVVGFFVLALADGIFALFERREFSLRRFMQCFRAPIVAGFSAFSLFACLAWPKMVTIATTDYSDIFSAYLEHSGLLDAIGRLVSTFGLGLILLILVSFVYLIMRADSRRIALLMALQFVFMFVHFSNTQTMGPHHLYVLMPAMLIVLCIAIATSITSCNRKYVIGGSVGLILTLLIGTVSAMNVFAPSGPPVARSLESGLSPEVGIVSQSYRPPLVRNDLDEFIRLVRYVDELLADGSQGSGLYVLAAAQMFNAAHFENISASTGVEFASVDQLLSSSVVDKRDGYPKNILRASIVITSDPILLSRRPEDQQVVRIPAEDMLSGSGIGAAFERLPDTFELEGQVEVIIFRRVRPNTVEEIADLTEKLRKFYPDRPYVYE